MLNLLCNETIGIPIKPHDSLAQTEGKKSQDSSNESNEHSNRM
jgi:hypothetical protein